MALSATTISVAAENRSSLDALFSYRVCAVSFNMALHLNTGTVGQTPD